MARFSKCTEQYAQKVFDSADIVRDGECRKLRNGATGFQASLMLLDSLYVIGG